MLTGGEQRARRRPRPVLIDMTVPNAARTADFLIGGSDNFAADRAAARALAATAPTVGRIPAAARAFRGRAVRYLAAEAGLRQFLDVGDGIAPPGATHPIAQAVDPCCRVVYTDTDPMALGRAPTLPTAGPGAVRCVPGDLGDVGALLAAAAPALDLGQPVGLLLMSTLAHVAATTTAARAVRSLMAVLPVGSHVVIYHLASDLDPALRKVIRQWNQTATHPVTLRSRAAVRALASGLDLLEPGVVPVAEWRPGPAGTALTPAAPVPLHALVARKG
jgi:hypothetical protein